MKTNQKALFLSGLMLAATVAPVAQAKEEKVLSGCYVPTRGYAKSSTFPEMDVSGDIIIGDDGQSPAVVQQLGRFKVELVRADWQTLSAAEREGLIKNLVLEGPFRGKCFAFGGYDCATLNHALGSDDRSGFVFTSGDSAVPLFNPPPTPCDGEGMRFVLTILETLRPIAGEGAYQGLIPEASSFQVEGTINECTGLNDFVVVAGEGQICFE